MKSEALQPAQFHGPWASAVLKRVSGVGIATHLSREATLVSGAAHTDTEHLLCTTR